MEPDPGSLKIDPGGHASDLAGKTILDLTKKGSDPCPTVSAFTAQLCSKRYDVVTQTLYHSASLISANRR